MKEKIMNISKKNLAIIISAASVALILIVVGIIALVNAIQNDSFFDYFKSDLSQYIEFSEDYKSFKFDLDISKPRDIDYKITELNMLRADKPTDAWVKGSSANLVIKPGDVVYIWYRGYLIDDDGNPVEIDGMTNFSGSDPYALEIGSNSFLPGFELSLVGQKTGDGARFEKITTGTADSGTIAYVSYTKSVPKDNGSTDKTTGSYVRLDLSDTTLDETYGEGFTEQLKSLTIGTKSEIKLQLDGKEVTYTDFIVNFVTTCETDEKAPLKVSCYFPYDYSNDVTLRNEDAVFEVYVAKIDSYYKTMPEFNDEYLTKKIEDKDVSVTLEELEKYDGDTLVEKYEKYAKELMMKMYEDEYASLVEETMWNRLLSIAKVKKLPTSKVDEKYYSYATDIYNLYVTNGGKIYNSYYGSYDSYDTLDDYANAYLGVNTSSSDYYYYYGTEAWKYYIYDMAEDFVKERIVLYYIIREEGLVPSNDVLKSEMDRIKQEYVDEYVLQYLDNEGKTEDDYTAEEFAEFRQKRSNEILGYYGDSHFEERVYYEIIGEVMVQWPQVVTLDERSAYPYPEDK